MVDAAREHHGAVIEIAPAIPGAIAQVARRVRERVVHEAGARLLRIVEIAPGMIRAPDPDLADLAGCAQLAMVVDDQQLGARDAASDRDRAVADMIGDIEVRHPLSQLGGAVDVRLHQVGRDALELCRQRRAQDVAAPEQAAQVFEPRARRRAGGEDLADRRRHARDRDLLAREPAPHRLGIEDRRLIRDMQRGPDRQRRERVPQQRRVAEPGQHGESIRRGHGAMCDSPGDEVRDPGVRGDDRFRRPRAARGEHHERHVGRIRWPGGRVGPRVAERCQRLGGIRRHDRALLRELRAECRAQRLGLGDRACVQEERRPRSPQIRDDPRHRVRRVDHVEGCPAAEHAEQAVHDGGIAVGEDRHRRPPADAARREPRCERARDPLELTIGAAPVRRDQRRRFGTAPGLRQKPILDEGAGAPAGQRSARIRPASAGGRRCGSVDRLTQWLRGQHAIDPARSSR